MPGIGNKLRVKRLSLGLSLRDASKKTRIKQKELEALEEEEVLRFKDKETAVEHVKTYAGFLDLDHTEILSDFENLWSDSSTANAYMQQQHDRENKFSALKDNKLMGYGAVVAAVALFLSVGGYLFWNNFFATEEPEEYYATSAEEVASEESAVGEAVEEEVVAEEVDQPVADEQNSNDLEDEAVLQEEHTNNEEEVNDYVASAVDDENADQANENANDDREELALEEEEEEEQEQEQEQEEEQIASADDNGLPQTDGFAYFLWFGILTFIVGLALFLPALLFKKNHDYDPVLGPPH